MDAPKRRAFLKRAGMAAAGTFAGAATPLGRWAPYGFFSSANAADFQPVPDDNWRWPWNGLPVPGKDGLAILSDRPLSAETLPHLLDDEVTPTERHFIRNNGIVPRQMEPATWSLRIDGAVERPMTLSIQDLRDRFEVVTYRLLLECAGNGPGEVRSAGQGEPVDLRRGLLCRVDRRPPGRRARCGGSQGHGGLYGA